VTYDEAINVISVVMRYWPEAERWSDDIAGQWAQDLQPWEFGTAITAVRLLHDTEDRAPSWAKFLQAARGIERAAEPERQAEMRALPAAGDQYPTREVALARTKRLRSTLSSLQPPRDHAELRAYQQAPADVVRRRRAEIANWVLHGGEPPAGIKERP
jgi:hypothetical protein